MEHLAAFYDVQRKSGEDDEAFRRRIQAKIMGLFAADSLGKLELLSYQKHDHFEPSLYEGCLLWHEHHP